ncbi:hypothetical protein CKM354_000023700 [Cercospora kikuchii]|uniref:Uncharacterized protein n=1 Tax=Cercospora kikuchii TaxID=84275 RepID=A0A9P3CAF1_9PEZI|nr:uncharacterized protein CKM354_000023700 [Cercospora kikuchii]GIZ36770.1 hypothetical protein CKM354_000023700 [Cercospora kikuchii]
MAPNMSPKSSPPCAPVSPDAQIIESAFADYLVAPALYYGLGAVSITKVPSAAARVSPMSSNAFPLPQDVQSISSPPRAPQAEAVFTHGASPPHHLHSPSAQSNAPTASKTSPKKRVAMYEDDDSNNLYSATGAVSPKRPRLEDPIQQGNFLDFSGVEMYSGHAFLSPDPAHGDTHQDWEYDDDVNITPEELGFTAATGFQQETVPASVSYDDTTACPLAQSLSDSLFGSTVEQKGSPFDSSAPFELGTNGAWDNSVYTESQIDPTLTDAQLPQPHNTVNQSSMPQQTGQSSHSATHYELGPVGPRDHSAFPGQQIDPVLNTAEQQVPVVSPAAAASNLPQPKTTLYAGSSHAGSSQSGHQSQTSVTTQAPSQASLVTQASSQAASNPNSTGAQDATGTTTQAAPRRNRRVKTTDVPFNARPPMGYTITAKEIACFATKWLTLPLPVMRFQRNGIKSAMPAIMHLEAINQSANQTLLKTHKNRVKQEFTQGGRLAMNHSSWDVDSAVALGPENDLTANQWRFRDFHKHHNDPLNAKQPKDAWVDIPLTTFYAHIPHPTCQLANGSRPRSDDTRLRVCGRQRLDGQDDCSLGRAYCQATERASA